MSILHNLVKLSTLTLLVFSTYQSQGLFGSYLGSYLDVQGEPQQEQNGQVNTDTNSLRVRRRRDEGKLHQQQQLKLHTQRNTSIFMTSDGGNNTAATTKEVRQQEQSLAAIASQQQQQQQHSTSSSITVSSSSSLSLFKNNNDESLPTFIFHPGPGKTGTTTIQCQGNMFHQQLLEDGVYYLGKGETDCGDPTDVERLGRIRDLTMCGYKYGWTGTTDEECRTKLHAITNEIDTLQTQHQTTLLSEEVVSPWMDELMEHVVAKNWHVKLVLTYRRYHEHLLSYYWFFCAFYVHIGWYDEWPKFAGDNELTIHSLPQFIQRQPSSTQLLQDYRHNYSDVQVFNMHDIGTKSMSGAFFCQVLDNSTSQVCNILSDKTQEKVANVGDDKSNAKRKPEILMDRIAVGAYHRGWLKPHLTRPAVRKFIQKKYAGVMGHDIVDSKTYLPMECLSEEDTQAFLNTTLDAERVWVPDFFHSDAGEPALRASFQKAYASNKYCSEDVDQLLDSHEHGTRWKELLRRMRK